MDYRLDDIGTYPFETARLRIDYRVTGDDASVYNSAEPVFLLGK